MSAFDQSVTDSAPASGRTRRRAWWGDLRFFLGLILIGASVAGVWGVVVVARQTRPVLAATETIVPGQRIVESQLRVVETSLGQVGGAYLEQGALAGGSVATRTIEAGELVPRHAVAAASEVEATTVVLRSSSDVPGSVRVGSRVDVWAAAPLERGSYETPRILVSGAVVASISRDDSLVGGGAPAVEVVIARSQVADALAAVTAGSAISIVPAAAR